MEPVLLFRNVAITTDYANFFPVLQEYGEKERLSRREVCARLGLGPGQADRIFHDAQLMKLVDGKGCILSLGRAWVKDVRQHGRPSPDTLRTAALNVSLFRETFDVLGDTTDAEKIFAYFVQRTGGLPREQDIGSARRRYLEGVLHVSIPRSIPRRSMTAHKQEQHGAAPERVVTTIAKETTMRRALRLLRQYEALVAEFTLAEIDEVHAIVHEKK